MCNLKGSKMTEQNEAKFIMASPLGDLEITMRGDALAGIRYVSTRSDKERRNRVRGRAARSVERQLNRYFSNPYWRFDLELALDGTPFQRRVWKQLTRIEPGKPLTYGDLARHLGSGPRAVGGACRSNPLPIVIPCHRVIARNSAGGYCGNMRGKFLQAKCWLLQHEHFNFNSTHRGNRP